jgi:hypothetical protein
VKPRLLIGLGLFMTLLVGVLPIAAAQNPHGFHQWFAEAPIPTAVWFPAATGLIKEQIYLVGGYDSSGATIADNQIYTPVTNSWSTGAPMPVATAHSASAVVEKILYLFGGSPDGITCDASVWAYDPKTNAWSSKAVMPTARCGAAAAVRKNIVYVIGGYFNGQRLDTVEAYDPRANAWSEKAPLLVGKSEPAVGLVETKIVATGGYSQSGDTGDNEAYDAATDTWTALEPDPSARSASCFGAVAGPLYVAGGYPGGGSGTPALDVAEFFRPSKNAWAGQPLMRQPSMDGGSAAYGDLLFCFGGTSAEDGTVLNNVQVLYAGNGGGFRAGAAHPTR